TTDALVALKALEPQLEEARARLEVAHENWEELDELGDRHTADASRHAAMLRGE
ncbi:MAG: hypothetical protein GWO24_38335, partial [Akkermansiaceae bacterium]|nr:hypothetical protein [Akkermansiaceae bacterium]